MDSKRKRALLERQKYSIWFDVSDFDSKTSVQDLIDEIRSEEHPQAFKSPEPINEDVDEYISDLFQLPKHNRLICEACGEEICDDKYICIPDPLTPATLRYYHSKGKCGLRKANVQLVREEWLQRQNEGQLL